MVVILVYQTICTISYNNLRTPHNKFAQHCPDFVQNFFNEMKVIGIKHP